MKTLHIVVETPRGSAQKYNYDKESHFFKFKKSLPVGMVFPYDFGFIPGTNGEDGDPLDLMLISEFPSFPGCLIECRLIGGIKAMQGDKEKNKMVRNDRFLAVPAESVLFEKINSINDLPGALVQQIIDFFINYNAIENVKFENIGILNAEESFQIIENSK